MKQFSSHQIIHVIFLGPPAVGKSCLLSGYKPLYQSEDHIQLVEKSFSITGKIVKFQLWNIPSSLTLKDSTTEYCKKGQIVACVYSVNDKNTFHQCQIMIEMLVKQNKLKYDAKFALISNKNDLQKLVEPKQGSQMACILNGNNTNNKIANNFFEVSAKNNSPTLQQLCKGFYDILEDKNIKNIAEVYQSGDPAPPQTAYQKALIDTEITANTLNNNNTHICRILILGDRYTGKTSIVKRFVNDTYTDKYQASIGVDFAIKQMQILGKTIKFLLFDASGSKKFMQTIHTFIKVSNFILLIYDCSTFSSFINLNQYIQYINNQKYNNNQSIFIIANKNDKQHLISIENGQQFAKTYNFPFYSTSPKQNIGISQLFYHIADIYLNKLVNNKPISFS